MSEIKYSELDFALIKENLKTFLKTQDKFKDYNFDGSSLSILLDILAYNTGYNAFYLNMLASEMFLDSATLRESVNSRAALLGYVPASVKSARALINYKVLFSDPGNIVPSNFLLSKNQQFYTNYQDTRYIFYPIKEVFFERLPDENGKKVFIANNVELIEGRRFTHDYTVNSSVVSQRFVIPNAGVDLESLVVTVKESASSTNTRIFRKNEDITLITSDSNIYFIQPYAYQSDLYEVIFGDNILGRSVVDGNIVSLDYVVSTGEDAVGAPGVIERGANFKTDVIQIDGVELSGTAPQNVITTISAASGYKDQESIDRIKLLAPRAYEAQNRAVTKYDYETLILKDVPLVERVRVWGGEENDPPDYGRVFCAIQPKTGTSLNQEDKNRIIDSYIRPRSLVSVEVIIVEPEYIGVTVDSLVNYDQNRTSLTSDGIKSLAIQSIELYRDENLTGFDSDLRFSKLLNYIDNSHPSVVSNITNLKIKYRLFPILDTLNNFKIVLNNEIDTGDYLNNNPSIISTPFYYGNILSYLSDDGRGNMLVYYISSENTKIILNNNVGSVSYVDGTITIKDLVFSSSSLSQINEIQLLIKPKYNDIISLRNQIIQMDSFDIKVTTVDISTLRLS